MNGHLIMDNNPLAKSVNLTRKNTVNNNTIGNNYRIKLGKINSHDIIKRQATQKIKQCVLKTEVKELNIEI